MGTAAVEVEALGKTYPPPFRPWRHLRGPRQAPRQALAEVALSIHPGEVVAIIGPNGAGKSTLLRILAGLLLPSYGHARVGGLDVVRDRPRCRQHVGAALGDDRGLHGRLTARQNLAFYGALYGLTRLAAKDRIAELAEKLDAAPLLDRPVRTLSTGEKARIVLARTLLHRPRVVLLDELSRSLDPGAALRVRRHIQKDVAGEGAAVLLASHDLNEVEALATRVLLLSQGKPAAYGPYAEVRPRAAEVFSLDSGGAPV